jgi:hypothetical protein
MTKWFIQTGKGLLPRELFFAPGSTKFRKHNPGPGPYPKPPPPPAPLIDHPYRDSNARFKPGHPYRFKHNIPVPKRKTKPNTPHDQYGRFASPTKPPKPFDPLHWIKAAARSAKTRSRTSRHEG